jgi:hypothetical protein
LILVGVFPAGNTIGTSQRLKFLAVICAALLQLPVAAPRHLKLPVFCRNMHPLLRCAILKHYPLSVELGIHSTSSSSISNGGTLQTTLTLCFLVKFSFVSNIDDTSISTNKFHHFSFIWNRKSYKFRILSLQSISKYYSHLSL